LISKACNVIGSKRDWLSTSTPTAVRKARGLAKLVPPTATTPPASGLYTGIGSAEEPPKATTSGFTNPGLRPGPVALYGARFHLVQRVSAAPIANRFTASPGGWIRPS